MNTPVGWAGLTASGLTVSRNVSASSQPNRNQRLVSVTWAAVVVTTFMALFRKVIT